MDPVDQSTESPKDHMTEKLLAFVKEVGIPAAICFYVLMRLEPAITGNTTAIAELTKVVTLLLASKP